MTDFDHRCVITWLFQPTGLCVYQPAIAVSRWWRHNAETCSNDKSLNVNIVCLCMYVYVSYF